MGSDPDTERTVVQVYVPAYQRDRWDEHAEELGMSRSEFVKTMVQAGRRGFGGEPADGESESGGPPEQSIREQVLETLAERGPLPWEALLTAVSGDVESRLEAAVHELESEDKVRYSGPAGGYVLEGDEP